MYNNLEKTTLNTHKAMEKVIKQAYKNKEYCLFLNLANNYETIKKYNKYNNKN